MGERIKCDIVFIGGGLNYAGAVTASRNGKNVVLVEQNLNHLGGTCLHNGCIPSKHLLHLSKTVFEIKNPAFKTKKENLELKAAQEELDLILSNASTAVRKQLENANVNIVEGKGFLTDRGKVETKDFLIEADTVVIGTGSYAFIPEGIEYNGENIITSDDALRLKNFPKNIAIYGNGAIGLEFATFFAISGVETTLIYRGEKLLKKADERINSALEKKLLQMKIVLKNKTSVLEAKEHEKGVRIVTDKGVMEYDMLFVATGRRACKDVIKTDLIKVEDKGIVTDDYFETSLKNHYAIGDCNGKLQLAHAARAEVLNVVQKICYGKVSKLNLYNIPKFIYTLPLSYANVGDIENSSKNSVFRLSSLTLSQSYDAKEGVIIIYADDEDFITGAEIFSPFAEELIGIVNTAINAELDKESFLKTVFAHPTFSEGIQRTLMKL